jgi:hypothetical protein
MSSKGRFVAAIAVLLIIAAGLGLWCCGKEPQQEAGGNPGEPSSLRSDGSLPTKIEERRPSKTRIRAEPAAALAKIKFNLDDIRPDGLRGPDDGLLSVSYEFCVPNDEKTLAEVRRIAPGVAIHVGSKGRIGCGEDQALCIGTTHGPDWRKELMGIAELGYVVEIAECYFE